MVRSPSVFLREHERFHDDRHDAARGLWRTDVNVVELTKVEAVERYEVAFESELIPHDRPERRRDVAIDRDDQWPAVGRCRDSLGQPADACLRRFDAPTYHDGLGYRNPT